MAAKERQVPDHVLALLEEMKADGALLHMHPRQLDRSDYEDLNKVVTALGGKWKGGKTKAHVFPSGTDVPALIDAVLATGRYEDPKDADFVETPAHLAHRMADIGRVRPGHRVLEPSAGLGRIALAARAAGAYVVCCELSEQQCAKLRALDFRTICGDFLLQHPGTDADRHGLELTAPPLSLYDVVLVNPPFSKQQDIDHVMHAFRFVRSGGRLVAIMSAGVTFRQNRKTVDFRNWVASHGGVIEELPDGTFKAEGTMVRAVIVTIDAP